ncbi:POU domain, class 6, transcription factor 2 isoform X1 [Petromyzon marinus]|uniref:POU domain, class 6, transcription factor 2-like isoform X1 n=1 Tax=Petromyzon marinus TaxID=7757 RepID=A0AAJ7SXH4_PETMA|nr:POU domain, class 6, transcription factor 2-like isoform X1 [Petromyzon marinus]XP_032807446.1 POU domain, class 6, transcription factor 2-like isoform X1 [Petromyzon marinus]
MAYTSLGDGGAGIPGGRWTWDQRLDAMISEHHQQQQLSRKALPLGSSLLSSEPGERRSIFGSLTGAEIQSSLLAAAERRAVFGMQGEAPAALAMEAERRALLAGCLMEARDPLFGGGGISGEGRAEAERRLEQELTILAAGGDRSCAARGHSGSAEGHDAAALQAGERHEPEHSPMHLKESSLMATRSDDSDQDGSMTPDTDCGATTNQGGETEQETSSSRQYPPATQPTGPQLVSPLLLPFGMAGVGSALGGAAGQAVGVGPQQGVVLTLPAASLANMQGLAAAAAAASGILALPLHNMQATSSLNAQIQQLHQLQQLQQQQQQQQQQHQQQQPQTQQAKHGASPRKSSSAANPSQPPSSQGSSLPLVGGPLTSPAAVAAVAAAVAASGSLPSSAHIFAGALAAGLPGVAGQLITNAQGQLIGTIPLVGGGGSGTGAAGMGATGLPLSPQLLTNTQGQVVAMLVGNQILPVLNPQGLTLSPMKAPGQQQQQQVHGQQGGQGSTPPGLLHVVPPGPGSLAHGQGGLGQSPGSSAPQSLSPSSPSVGQLVNNPQGPCGEVDGVNLEEMREFARAFKIRRLSLGLTQTQVGQALSAAEGPAYSQSAICRNALLMRADLFLPAFGAARAGDAINANANSSSSLDSHGASGKLNPGLLCPARFEKLDITPKSAQKIKPVLERWMEEAEARKQAGLQSLSDFVGGEPSKKRKRRTSFTPQALELLNAHFERNTHPSGQEMTAIAERLCYDREVVRVWFCNKRQALKNTIKRLKQHDPATPPPPLPPPPPPALPKTPQSLVVPQLATGLPKVVVTETGPGTFEHAALSQGLTKIPAEEESSHGFD